MFLSNKNKQQQQQNFGKLFSSIIVYFENIYFTQKKLISKWLYFN